MIKFSAIAQKARAAFRRDNIKKWRLLPRFHKINGALVCLFLLSAVVFFVQWLTAYLTSGNGFEIGLFQRTQGIAFSDFFHANEMVYENSPYYADMSSYPPLALLMAKFFGSMADYADGYENMLSQPAAVFSLVLFYLIFAAAVVALLLFICKKQKFPLVWLIGCLVGFFICAPMLFQFERGNYMAYALLFSLLFFAFYDHEKPLFREIALISLGIATGIKLYPALFALVLLREKRFAEFLRAAAYAALLLILPFLFFDKGFSNISRFLYWLTDFSGELTDYGYNYSLASFIEIVATLFGHSLYASNSAIQTLQSVLPVLSLAVCAVAALFCDKKWKAFALAAIAMIQFPSISFCYAGVVLWIPLLSFMIEKEKSKRDWLYALLFYLSLTPVFMGFAIRDNAVTVNLVLTSVSLIVMELCIAAESALRAVRWTKAKIAYIKEIA